ncbi:MAG: RND transporter [Flavobacteriales bacterium]|nr:RND transporter [Flavobacteriales bacterium]
MYRKKIHSIFFLTLALCINFQKAIPSEIKSHIDEVLEEKEDKIKIDYALIEEIILQNQELKSLEELVSSASFNLSSKISKKYPSLDLQASGLPKYVSGENYNSNSLSTKTSQFSANPSLNIKWDLIDPIRGSEIKIAKENYKIAKNNYQIKRKDLIQEARVRYHKYQKSYQDIKNKKYALDLSITSLENAKSKLDAGIGTKFEVLEADAQLSRDKQTLNEKKIEHKINKILLKEILNIKGDFDINPTQKLIGFWDYNLKQNIINGMRYNLSLENISLQKEIKKNQAISYLNANRPKVYISNTFSTAFSKGDYSSTSIDPSEYGSSYTNTISLNFSWNIFSGGKNKNSYKSSQAEAKAEDYSYYNFKNLLKTRISKAYLNLKLNEEKIISSHKEISSTKESLRLSRLRYDVGISTLKDVLIRQKELSNAKSKKINGIYNYNLNLNELERLTSLKISNNCLNKIHNLNNEEESICNILK